MGQYHQIVNFDKRQYINPHKMGEGVKMSEFIPNGMGAMMILGILLARDSSGRGGDINISDPLIGSWAGDRIAIVGDYGDETYSELDSNWTEITAAVRRVIERSQWSRWASMKPPLY